MKKIIIHIGLPKTATTTIQENIFYKAHKKGLIHYLGRAHAEEHYYPIEHEIINPILFFSDPKFEANKYQIKTKLESIIHSINHETIIISDEFLSSTDMRLHGYNTLRTAQRLQFLFSKFNTEVVIVLRNQYDMIHSAYVQSYYLQEQFSQTDTFDKFLDFNLNRFPKSDFMILDYYTIISTYRKIFAPDKIHVLLFEDFKRNKRVFYSKLAEVFNLELGFIEEGFATKHNIKRKTIDHGAFTNDILLTRRMFDKSFLSSLVNHNKISVFLYNLYRENTIIKKIFYYTYMQVFRFKRLSKSIFIPNLNDEQKEKVRKILTEGNENLSSLIKVNLKEYGYPL